MTKEEWMKQYYSRYEDEIVFIQKNVRGHQSRLYLKSLEKNTSITYLTVKQKSNQPSTKLSTFNPTLKYKRNLSE